MLGRKAAEIAKLENWEKSHAKENEGGTNSIPPGESQVFGAK